MEDYMLTFELNKEDESQELAIHGSPLWQDSWHYLIFNQLGGSGVESASLFR